MPIMSYNETGEEVDLTPAAFKEQEWAKNIKSAEDLFSQFDNAQKLIGKSVQIPAEDAAVEDWGKVYTKLGRPEKPEDYALNVGEADATLKEQAAALSKIFHDNGLSKKQAAKLMEGVQTMTAAQMKQMQDAAAAKDTEFEALMAKTFGDKKDEATKVTRNLIEKFAPPELQNKMKDLPAEQLTLLAAVLKGVQDTYISEDDLKNLGGTGASSGAKTAEEYRKEGMRLMALPEYSNIMHVDHTKTVQAVKDAYAKMGELNRKV